MAPSRKPDLDDMTTPAMPRRKVAQGLHAAYRVLRGLASPQRLSTADATAPDDVTGNALTNRAITEWYARVVIARGYGEMQ